LRSSNTSWLLAKSKLPQGAGASLEVGPSWERIHTREVNKWKGGAIGAGVGSAAGTGVVLTTHGDPAVVPGESRLAFKLRGPVTVTLP
jgi:hypothetical protein